MKYGSVCSGIEAASVAWEPLGWKASFLSEIEPFPRSLLEHHYPSTPLHGDFTTIQDGMYEPIDLLVGGTPCQSFSVAGLRKGLDDPRGNLMLGYGALAKRLRPRWLVWENVPGVLSANGGRDFSSFLDMLEELHYVVDVDILDAQYFGVAQRRRRVFVCGQHVDNLLSQKSTSSALTITQCLMEILHAILIEAFPVYERLPESSEYAKPSKDGAIRRIKLFKMLGDQGHWQMLLVNLTEALVKCQNEAKSSAEKNGSSERERIAADLLMDLKKDLPCLPTEESLRESLAVVYEAMKSFTMSTLINPTTTLQISLFKAALNIASLTAHLSGSSPSSLASESSSLITLMEFTNYARHSSSDLFADPQWFCEGSDLIGQALQHQESFGYLGDWRRAAAVLFERDSLRGNPAPSREKGKEVAGTISSRTTGGGGLGTDFECSGGLQAWPAETASTLNASFGSKLGLENQHINSGAPLFVPAYGIPGNWIGRAPENGGNAVEPMIDVSPCQTTTDRHGVAYAFDSLSSNSMKSSNPYSGCREVDAAKTLDATRPDPSCNQGGIGILQQMAVRRLTPTECERLQGFPDGYTLVPHRGKPSADGPRYKALGNSMAVPVMRWIGERIQAVETHNI